MKSCLRVTLFGRFSLLTSMMVPIAVSVDMGPKPSVVLEFVDMEDDRNFYVTLLSKTDSTGSYSALGKFGGN